MYFVDFIFEGCVNIIVAGGRRTWESHNRFAPCLVLSCITCILVLVVTVLLDVCNDT